MNVLERILSGIIQSRTDLSRKRGYEVTAEDAVCGFIVDGVVRRMPDVVVDVAFELPGTTHHVLRTKRGKQRVVDGQYKQFIPHGRRHKAPDTLILETLEPRHVRSRLRRLGMSTENADAYSRAVSAWKEE